LFFTGLFLSFLFYFILLFIFYIDDSENVSTVIQIGEEALENMTYGSGAPEMGELSNANITDL